LNTTFITSSTVQLIWILVLSCVLLVQSFEEQEDKLHRQLFAFRI